MRKEDLYIDVERFTRLYIRLKNNYYSEESVLLQCRYAVSDRPVPWCDREKGEFRELHEGERWGKLWQSAWMHVTGTIPPEWRNKPLALRLNVSGEALIFDDCGVPLYGLCATSCMGNDYVKEYYDLTAPVPEKIDLWLEAAANGMFGEEDLSDTPNLRNPHFGETASRQTGICQKLRLTVINTELRELFYDVEALWQLMQCIGENDYRYTEIVQAGNLAFAALDDDPANAAAARACLAPLLRRPAMASAKEVTAVGHAHIDVAWLWPLDETIRKSARTFASQVYNLEHHPDFVFGASQPQNYQFIKDHYPELFEKIRRLVKAGRWELQGGMWVESDCNLINGESMVRQFVHGQKFFKDEFGTTVRNLWLPDVFGYPASIPQIARKSGCSHMVTQKISKNRINEFPYHTFYWTGSDNSRIMTHFLPENNYNSYGSPLSYIKAQNRFAERDFMGEFLSLTGMGDGGGGPAESHIQRLKRCRNMEGVPKVKFGRADEYFDRIERKYGDRLPEWNGELYLEMHQGTFTTQALTKKLNRQTEQALNAAEILIACAGKNAVYAAELDSLWKTVLCNQFHDILPGSSINCVYQRSEKELQQVIDRCHQIAGENAASIFPAAENTATLVNTLSSPAALPVTLPESWGDDAVLDAAGNVIPCQCENGRVIVQACLAPFAAKELRRAGVPAPQPECDDSLLLENDLIRYTFAPDGTLVSAFDKTADRELIAPGSCGNKFALYSDVPNNFDAWNLDAVYRKSPAHPARCTGYSKRFKGAVRSFINFEFETGEKSAVSQKIILNSDSKLLTFETTVQWQECHRMLRVAFPVELFANLAAYEIPYAYIMRPTYNNTSWEAAQYEVPLQRYMDISERDYGVALLNDCKYGGKINKNVIELTLLRSPKYPDYHADMGEHRFTYALLPHDNDLAHCREVRDLAASLNRPPLCVPERAGNDLLTLPCRVKSENISLEAVKKAEKDDSIIIRLVETQGRRGSAEITLAENISQISETDLIEQNDREVMKSGNTVKVILTPFEIRTFRLK